MTITRRTVLAGGAALALASRLNAAAPNSLEAAAVSRGRHFGSAIGMGQYPDPRYRAVIEAECGRDRARRTNSRCTPFIRMGPTHSISPRPISWSTMRRSTGF